jgi:hypothetical protein
MKNELNKKLFFAFVIMIFSGLICFHIISAEEVNYSVNSNYEGIQVTSLKYEPYPANPGEYVDVWIKANIGSSSNYGKFEVLNTFPFSVDSSENPIREYDDFSGDVVMHYKVRVDKDAVEGTNQLKIKIYSDKYSSSGSIYSMDIDVAEAQTDFDLVVQDYTTSEISLAIANIGKTTANSMIVRIPEQEGYKVSGTNGQMIGNLESGDYTVTSFSLTQVGRNPGNLKVQIDYTDSIGVRRSVIKEVQFGSQSSSANVSGTFSGAYRNFSGGNFPGMQTKKPKWPYFLAGGLLLVIIGFFAYGKYKKSGKSLSKKEKKNVSKDTNVPEWVRKINEKERK